ncbi:hypothetical protein ANO14919_074320 [Xylariales sp. No.14919]|nr:hypothetical protein ANO14919_074320 [Xylariales sp. No.14919]
MDSTPRSSVPQPASKPLQERTKEIEEDTREQPWQSLMPALKKQNEDAPVGQDFFPCQDGFYAHSLAA